MSADEHRLLDLLVVGAGPTGIAIAAEARRSALEVLVVDQGPLLASLLQFPRDMVFFTTADKLEIAGIPFSLPHAKPSRREAITYYQGVVRAFDLPLELHQRVTSIRVEEDVLEVTCLRKGGERRYRSHAVALATGYFDSPRRLGVPGESLGSVQHRYDDPYRHFGERVVVVGGGNSAAEAAMELWRAGARVTVVHRGQELKPSVKYWLKPDFENRVAEGAFEALYEATVKRFERGTVTVMQKGQQVTLAADATYVLIGYEPDVELLRASGVEVDDATLVPAFDPESCESNVAGLYLAGTLQAGRDTNRIFIENSRAHAPQIIRHLAARLGRAVVENSA